MPTEEEATYVCAGCGGGTRQRHAPVVCPECGRPTMDRIGGRR